MHDPATLHSLTDIFATKAKYKLWWIKSPMFEHFKVPEYMINGRIGIVPVSYTSYTYHVG